ncbi:hypothetical protein NDU88_003886 [Pleurodeles waltl]|uniref:Uncharacterized protein n=1 Tax=Pleurodeles waltl TaxID=8319 RepID=A0AAV7MRV9_PLEWA|nr:hypothetical protein NDU88_003886 [Pleurodeles waltl]
MPVPTSQPEFANSVGVLLLPAAGEEGEHGRGPRPSNAGPRFPHRQLLPLTASSQQVFFAPRLQRCPSAVVSTRDPDPRVRAAAGSFSARDQAGVAFNRRRSRLGRGEAAQQSPSQQVPAESATALRQWRGPSPLTSQERRSAPPQRRGAAAGRARSTGAAESRSPAARAGAPPAVHHLWPRTAAFSALAFGPVVRRSAPFLTSRSHSV